MENLRAFAEDVDFSIDGEEESRMEAPPEIGFDERRMHVRAYNYWVSLLNGRSYPSIEDLEPENLDDFGPNSVLLDFTCGADNPAIAFLGKALREQCELGDDISTINQVPSRSLLSRLTDHYLQIIANCAPIGFEAEFVSLKGVNTMYRGILMPLSSDGDTIDFIYGVINWKETADAATTRQLNAQIGEAVAAAPHAVEASPIWADGPTSMPEETPPLPEIAPVDDNLELGLAFEEDESPTPGFTSLLDDVEAAPVVGYTHDDPFEPAAPHEEPAAPEHIAPAGTQDQIFGPVISYGGARLEEEEEWIPETVLDENAGLADRLSVARESADAVKSADSRSRSALYGALSQAYDFALAAEADPQEFAEILEDSGLKAQDRAPMTPVVKLIFGIDYDKTRLTEFAAALSYARRQELEAGGLLPLLETFEGGLKGLVAAERRERRPQRGPDFGETARDFLREAEPLALLDIEVDGGEFVLLVARRETDGRLAVVAPVRADPGMIDRAIRKSV